MRFERKTLRGLRLGWGRGQIYKIDPGKVGLNRGEVDSAADRQTVQLIKTSRHLFRMRNSPPQNKHNKREKGRRESKEGREERGALTRSALFYSGPCVL